MSDFGNKIYALKTTANKERKVVDDIVKLLKDHPEFDIKSIMAPDELRGYVLIETPDEYARMEQIVRLIPNARAVVKGETSFEEVEHFLEPKAAVAGIDEGTIVELIAGPFKGEKAVVKRVDAGKEEITVELYESMVPIPITVRGDNVRVIEKAQE
ncbi:transcription elongation factor Spt5 [Methanomicrobiaceae archaeon CYW5]|uniref:transcription elongation factor Spt5 n=1 Tax=Methanovulcanius yangii TaxID=1789227 RepID=UPI0029C9FE38|nr:transcription elongation factor Spt5 [Methanovulcanius yangii]MBT8508190.1 transcription elongation factor Spt5 [Methanovulcanius yangii]